jgi:hypothetical protein
MDNSEEQVEIANANETNLPKSTDEMMEHKGSP